MNSTKLKTKTSNMIKTLLLPVVVYIVFAVLSRGRFVSSSVFWTVLRNSCQNMVMAWGAMLIIGSGMWDFSGGAQLYLTAFLTITLFEKTGVGVPVLILFLIGLNILLRVLVGGIYTLVHVKSMVCTMALCMIFESACKYFWGSAATLLYMPFLSIANVPNCFIVLAVGAAAIVLIWNRTTFAYHVRALGSGEHVARNIGLNPVKIRFMTFVVQGLFLGLAAILLLATNVSVSCPTNLSSNTLNFNALMAVYIGMALERYTNRITAVGVGTVVMTMLNSGLISMGIDSSWQVAVTGVFMAAFIGFSTNQNRVIQWFEDRKRAEQANLEYAQRN